MIAVYMGNIDLHIFDRIFGIEYVFNPRQSTHKCTILYNGINHYDGTNEAAGQMPHAATSPATTMTSSALSPGK